MTDYEEGDYNEEQLDAQEPWEISFELGEQEAAFDLSDGKQESDEVQ